MAKISLIDRNELIEHITAESDEIITDNAHAVGMHNGLELAKAMVFNAPTIDAELVKHGQWIPCENGGYYCSNCDTRVTFLVHNRYCQNCGAKMY